MMRWSGLLLAAAMLTGCGPAEETVDARPNIVFMMADDMGYGDPGAYDPGSKVPTPHTDRLAAEGMRFTDGHSPSAV
ncbi:MAG: sulfatase-like hydrolase/transferase, partial [bacterium]|nr:sulfatase-like hydrolase/transferase [bacterium]